MKRPPTSSLLPRVVLGLGLLLLLLPGAPLATAKEEPATTGPLAIPRSEYVRYTVERVDTGKPTVHKDRARGIWGHAIENGQRWRPGLLADADIPLLLAYTLPEGTEPLSVKEDLAFRETVLVRLTGKVARSADGNTIEGQFTFASKKKGEKKDVWRITKGKAKVTSTYDPAARHLSTMVVEYSFQKSKVKPERGETPRKVSRAVTMKLHARIPRRSDDFEDKVSKAIDKGVAYLRTIQIKPPTDHAGAFGPYGQHYAGSTALALLTLAACDVSRNDPAITEGLRYLLENPPKKTYGRALALMALDKIYVQKDGTQHRMLPDVRDFAVETLEALLKSANAPGTWGYPAVGNTSFRFDTSNTQYAVLGLRSAARLGLKVPEKVWLGVVRYAKQLRGPSLGKGRVYLTKEGQAALDDGRYAEIGPPPMEAKEVAGFRYATLDQYSEPYGSMTAAMVACLAIAQEQLALQGSSKLNPKLRAEIRGLMLGGWVWLDRNWGVDRNPAKQNGRWYYYWLYSLERAAILDAVKRVSGRDWYFEGAQELLLRQGRDGGWPRSGAVRISRTCFALLFLKRATAPITSHTDGK